MATRTTRVWFFVTVQASGTSTGVAWVRRVTARRGSAPNASAGRAGPKRKPWPSSHPIARSCWSCSGVSMPSATVDSRRARARLDDRVDDRGAVLLLAHPRDERPVDLQRLDREPLEVRQRRVAGAEVVDREVEAESTERTERAQRRLGVAHQRALGDLEPERARHDARVVQDTRHVVRQRGLGELAGREVHAHREWRCVGRGAVPARRLRGRPARAPRRRGAR